jgi:hypothetical protein
VPEKLQDSTAKRVYTKRRAIINDKVARLRYRTNPKHFRIIHCFQVDDTGDQYAVHYRCAEPHRHYTRTFTEWFEKVKWDFVPPGERVSLVDKPSTRKGIPHVNSRWKDRVRAREAENEENLRTGNNESDKEWAALKAQEAAEEAAKNPQPVKTRDQILEERIKALEARLEPERPALKPPAPRIQFAEDEETPSEEDDEDKGEVEVRIDPKTNLKIVGKPVYMNEQRDKKGNPTEYNRHVHKDMFFGKPEDLAVFDAHVTSNAAMTAAKAKMAGLRHKRELIAKTQDGPMGSGASFTPDGTDGV